MDKQMTHSEPGSPAKVLLSSSATKIVLEVGERRFITTRQTLEQSTFFSSLLSGRWDNQQADGSYFIDGDPVLFDHVLRFLRRGTLPLFYDQTNGHDYALYHALLGEAKYFGIKPLENWLVDKGYEKMVNVRETVETIQNTFSSRYPHKVVFNAGHHENTTFEYRTHFHTTGSQPGHYPEDKVDIVRIGRETTFDEKICSEDRYL